MPAEFLSCEQLRLLSFLICGLEAEGATMGEGGGVDMQWYPHVSFRHFILRFVQA